MGSIWLVEGSTFKNKIYPCLLTLLLRHSDVHTRTRASTTQDPATDSFLHQVLSPVSAGSLLVQTDV